MRREVALGLVGLLLIGLCIEPAAAQRRNSGRRGGSAYNRQRGNTRGANRRAGGNRANQRHVPLSEFDLQTEVQALKDRHSALAVNLPQELRRLDRETQPLLDRMPLLVQDVYYRTVEDYRSLTPDEQRRLGDTLWSLRSVSSVDQQNLVNQVTKEFGPVQADAAQRKDALARSHQTLFRLLDVVNRLGKPAGSG
jgi:hypothetical protein